MNDEMDWMDESASEPELANQQTKRPMNRKPQPARITKTVYAQKAILRAWNRMCLEQKDTGGPSGPELTEEALITVIEKYSGKSWKEV